MLTGNKLFKLNTVGQPTRITTDDIPEGEFNKYCLAYADGKLIGDIVVRPSKNEPLCHHLANGQKVYEYTNKDFYQYCLDNKNKASQDSSYEYFNKTLQEYEEFLAANVWEETNENYCPYFVVDSEEIQVYEASNGVNKGYTNIAGSVDMEVESGYIYVDELLTETLDKCDDWFYTGESQVILCNYVKLPTYPTFVNGSNKLYYFIVTSSRVDDNTTSIRSVSIGSIETLEDDQEAYITNSGTMQNLILDFGIPRGISSTVTLGEVKEGDLLQITNSGDDVDAIFNFTIPRGPRGNAGGVMELDAIVSQLPHTADTETKVYNTTDNVIYIYNGSDWQKFEDADAGLIYIYESNIYYFNGTGLAEMHARCQVDEETVVHNAEGKLEAVAVKTVQGNAMFDWVGTLKEWEKGRSDGTIPDNYICYVTDDTN